MAGLEQPVSLLLEDARDQLQDGLIVVYHHNRRLGRQSGHFLVLLKWK
jgi:hypothetical protein